MITRDALTKVFLNQWDKSTDEANVKFYSRKWWLSNRISAPHSFRLTEEGYEFLIKTLNLKAYEIPFTEAIELSPQVIVFLGRYIDCPYFLTHKSITVFSELKHFELVMFSDDIRKYGFIKAMNERQKLLKDI